MVAELAPRLLAAAAIALAASGCAGARTSVVADSALYPISMSRAVRDADGNIVPEGHLEKVGRFHDESLAWGLVYSAVPLTPRKDISGAVNEQMGATKGEAVVNVTIGAKNCVLNMIWPLTILPFWPGCTKIIVDGDIVRVASAKETK